MTQSCYSWYGTRIHLMLDDKLATDYNRAADKFYEAQRNYHKQHGIPWDGEAELNLEDWTEAEKEAWNGLSRLIRLLRELNGDHTEMEVTSGHLVKLKE